MAFDIAIKSHDYSGNEDRTWLLTRKGFDTCRSGTLDVSLFNANHLTAKGAIPSGTLLGKVTASGKLGPYDTDAVNGLQTCVGFLFNTTVVGSDGSATNLATAADVGVPFLWEGVIDESQLPAFAGTTDGEIDAGAKADLTHCVFE
jgi:hypothetical protein